MAHRQPWLDWVNRDAEVPLALVDFDLRHVAEHERLGRRLVIDIVADDSYDGFLLGWYGPDGDLESVLLEDDEAGVTVLQP